jgi:hypothetical protein
MDRSEMLFSDLSINQVKKVKAKDNKFTTARTTCLSSIKYN